MFCVFSLSFSFLWVNFRYALIYLCLSVLIRLGYYLYFLSVLNTTVPHLQLVCLYTSHLMVLLTSVLYYFLTYTKFYRVHTTLVSMLTIAAMCGQSLIVYEFVSIELFSPLGHFCVVIEYILLIYTMIPLRLWQNCATAAAFTISFEALRYRSESDMDYRILAMRLLLHLCVHCVGFHTLIMNVVRMRGTFIEVGQNLLVKRQLEMEKQVN